MSELKVTTLKHADSAVDSIVMASDGTLAFGAAVTDSAGVAVKGGVPAQAWVNFNGTGTVAIRRAFNVSSITDNGQGDYVINFTNAMVDGSYLVGGSAGGNQDTTRGFVGMMSVYSATAPTAAACRVAFGLGSNTVGNGQLYNSVYSYVAIFS